VQIYSGINCNRVYTKDVMHERTERGEGRGVPSPAGALPEPLAM
jgi:hypothetical protein